MFYPIELWGLINFVSSERVKGIEPSSSAWKADALTIVLHSQDCYCVIVSLVELESTTYTLAYHYYFHSLTFISIGILDTFSKI